MKSCVGGRKWYTLSRHAGHRFREGNDDESTGQSVCIPENDRYVAGCAGSDQKLMV